MSAETYSAVVLAHFWIGALVSLCGSVAAWLVAGYLARSVYFRLKRVYSLTVIWYWLDRLEREGTHTFEKARADVSKKAVVPARKFCRACGLPNVGDADEQTCSCADVSGEEGGAS